MLSRPSVTRWVSKGAGEAGTVGALPATMNAVLNALAEAGVIELDMPATPNRVWQAVRDARSVPVSHVSSMLASRLIRAIGWTRM